MIAEGKADLAKHTPAYIDEKENIVIVDPRRIRLHYLQSVFFYIDFVSTFPWDYLFKPLSNDPNLKTATKMIGCIKMLRLLRLAKFFRWLHNHFGSYVPRLSLSVRALLLITAHTRARACTYVHYTRTHTHTHTNMYPRTEFTDTSTKSACSSCSFHSCSTHTGWAVCFTSSMLRSTTQHSGTSATMSSLNQRADASWSSTRAVTLATPSTSTRTKTASKPKKSIFTKCTSTCSTSAYR